MNQRLEQISAAIAALEAQRAALGDTVVEIALAHSAVTWLPKSRATLAFASA
jgi:hypothetical protein